MTVASRSQSIAIILSRMGWATALMTLAACLAVASLNFSLADLFPDLARSICDIVFSIYHSPYARPLDLSSNLLLPPWRGRLGLDNSITFEYGFVKQLAVVVGRHR